MPGKPLLGTYLATQVSKYLAGYRRGGRDLPPAGFDAPSELQHGERGGGHICTMYSCVLLTGIRTICMGGVSPSRTPCSRSGASRLHVVAVWEGEVFHFRGPVRGEEGVHGVWVGERPLHPPRYCTVAVHIRLFRTRSRCPPHTHTPTAAPGERGEGGPEGGGGSID